MSIDKDTKYHTILWGIAKRSIEKKDMGWLGTVVNTNELNNQGPISVYHKQTVLGDLIWLEKKGYVDKIEIYGKKVGYGLTEKGINYLEENGKPKQYH